MTQPTDPPPTGGGAAADNGAAAPAPSVAPPSPAPAAAASDRPRTWVLVAIGVAIALVAGVVGGLIGHRGTSGTSRTGAADAMCPGVQVADQVLPTVVTISATGAAGGGTGSGEIIRSDGYILTNNHVISVAAPAGRIAVLLSSGQSLTATLVGRDARVDLAVIKVSSPEALPAIATADSGALSVGQAVVALGAPLGLSGSVTSGIISALGRTISVPGDGGQPAVLPGAIQTDASINPGNSGGPLVNCAGQLIGVNSAIATVPNEAGQAGGGSVGIGFAIPTNLATQVADELISTGTVSYPYFGASLIPIPAAVADRFGSTEGLFVQSVVAGGPAAQAGLAAGDVITQVDGRPATSVDELVARQLSKRPGDTVRITYVRAGQAATTTVTLGTRP